jgi:predicted CoA-substrate-specific enzyme activase
MDRTSDSTIVGIDIGAVSLALVESDLNGNIIHTDYIFHRGQLLNSLKKSLQRVNLSRVGWIVGNQVAASMLKTVTCVHPQVAAVKAALKDQPGLSSLLIVGGEKFSLVRLGKNGEYLDSAFNSSCAAGTGSFLDQQAGRLGLGSSAELADIATQFEGQPPKIASRCAVFAKTDLIHAQQEGQSLDAICAGLCQGLAANVVDALFDGSDVKTPLVICGGVAKNQAVCKYLENLLECELIVPDNPHLWSAWGAVLHYLDLCQKGSQEFAATKEIKSLDDWLISMGDPVEYYYPELKLEYSQHPGDQRITRIISQKKISHPTPVEVDEYDLEETDSSKVNVIIGIDIGSTSTKAVLWNNEHLQVMAGFYTRTAGRPLHAMQVLLHAILQWSEGKGIEPIVQGVGTTGSGRKFVGAVVGADLIIDEITAHAKAAHWLDPNVDTIIEIGGQDAKFTTLSAPGGVVTQAIMNHVCAAGTGSFIEEQANRLGVSIEEIADLAEGKRAPLSSDRCTVFMERDLNHFLSSGVDRDDVMCAVLHAVRDNYLRKVALESQIGSNIWFQGATAWNRALVAAFEQKLKRPVNVSVYCHLTGALGVALKLAQRVPNRSGFRGFQLIEQDICVRSEVCSLCKNHCKIQLAEVMGKSVGYGFLCGREFEDTRSKAAANSENNLLRIRNKHFKKDRPKPISKKKQITIGLPAGLHMFEELPLWECFFSMLGLRTIKLPPQLSKKALARGKRLAGAEFCAPLCVLHAEVEWLATYSDGVFLPVYLERKRQQGRRQYCYYTQFAPPLLKCLNEKKLKKKLIKPVLKTRESFLQETIRLYNGLKPVIGDQAGFFEVAVAYWRSCKWFRGQKSKLENLSDHIRAQNQKKPTIVLLGRPYTLLNPAMNAGIMDVLANFRIPAVFQDMLAAEQADSTIESLVQSIHWNYAAKIMSTANLVASSPGLYPVLVTSFKCAPDSCTMERFRRIMENANKPYLILQLDEHDSRVGYETRIEAAIRTFSDHMSKQEGDSQKELTAQKQVLPVNPTVLRKIGRRKTLLIPRWDPVCCRFFAANLRREGFDAKVLEENSLGIARSLRTNNGQCIPLNAIVQGFIDYVRKYDLDPAQSVLWMPGSQISCNVGFFSHAAQGLLQAAGGGFEKSDVYYGDIMGLDISMRATTNTYLLFLIGGLLHRMVYHTRPYECVPGETDAVAGLALNELEQAIEGKKSRRKTIKQIVDRFLKIGLVRQNRPMVAIFGDLYARDNDVMNQDLFRTIEKHGGEVLTTPFSDIVRITAEPYFAKWRREGNYHDWTFGKAVSAAVTMMEKIYRPLFERVLGPLPLARLPGNPEKILARYGVDLYHTGESFDNLLKVHYLLSCYPSIRLFVQTNPAFCCPSLVTEGMAKEIERQTGVPIVTLTYDGTTANKNDQIVPYLELVG